MSSFKLWMDGTLVPVILFGFAAIAHPSSANAEEISGLVQDALGRAILNANVSLQNSSGEVISKAQSDASGKFFFSNVYENTYALVAEKSGFQVATSIVTIAAGKNSSATLTLTSENALEVEITTERITQTRNGLSPKTGGSVYNFDAGNIDNLPQGDSTPINQVLLQAPGVVNDSFGQLHVRGEHANTQYRINGVILPEGISGFGQAIDARFAQKIDLLTGALPAQFGYRTAGVIEITTKNNFEAGGSVDLLLGSNQTYNPSFEYGNTKGDLTYFVDGSFLTNSIGIENPTPSVNPIHDQTNQDKGFAYLSYLLNPTTKLNFMFGSYDGRFQIPNNPGQTPDPNGLGLLGQMGLTGYNSATLNDQQTETNRFGVAALQSSLNDNLDYQISMFTRYSSFHYMPDITGNLAFNGVASDVFKSSSNTGIQADGSDRLNDIHTLRMGIFGSSENVVSNDTSTVFNVNGSGTVFGVPYAINDNNSKNGNTLLGIYLQDEWKATDKLTLNYGGRLDIVNAYVSEQQFSPRLGAMYKANEKTSLHVGYARYFTPPPAELVTSSTLALFNGTTNAATGLNSPVKAERGDYYDVGVTHQLTPSTSLGFDSFYKQTQNTLDEGQFGPALLMTPFNYAEGKIYGIELTGNYKSGDLSGYANLARTVSMATNIISSQYLFDPATLNYAANNWVNVDHAQALTVSVGSSYLWAGTRWTGDVIYESGMRNGFANTSSLPAYTVVNFGAIHKMDFANFGKIDVRVVVNNAFDNVYEIRDGSGIGVFAPQYGARRGIFLGLSKKF